MRLCPNCSTERAPDEMFCEGEVDSRVCGWPLSTVTLRPEGWRPLAATTTHPTDVGQPKCTNGHEMELGDLLCGICGADAASMPGVVNGTEPVPENIRLPVEETKLAGWRLLNRLPSNSQVRERFETIRDEDGREAVLTLYSNGSEPDPEIYEVLKTLDRDHVPEIFDTGRWEERAYEVSEDLRGGTLADVGLLPDDVETLSIIVKEIGGALFSFAECGLRHRDLRPGAIMVRAREPLDLVVTDFGSARLSDYDLDVVSPLEITRYTAPEAVAGGVAAASDWWSLGMLLLEQVTRGACFAGADDQSFLINVLTNGAPIPDGLHPRVDLLLRGLLAVDRRQRWGWSEAQRWLAGEAPDAPDSRRNVDEAVSRRWIELGGRRVASPERFALAAAEAANWDSARGMLMSGEITTWLEEVGCPVGLRTKIRAVAAINEISEDFRLALALKALNPSMPLVVRSQIVTPGWLLDHPDEGYALITGPIPDRLEHDDDELWLARLKRRELRVRDRARQLDVQLDESQVRVAVLSTSKSRLAAIWDERRRVLPDTDHPGLLAIAERKVTEEEDLILLLSAATSQFRAADAIIEEAEDVALKAGLETFDRDAALERLMGKRHTLNAEIETRLEGFARCGLDRIDEWADRFRLERRLPLARALALLAVPLEHWQQPPRQSYVATLLDFYARRITGSIMRGPLTRMIIGKTTARVDLMELDSPRRRASAILDHLLLRNEQQIDIDPAPLTDDPRLERRVRTLHSHATLYRRDTGIDGLYLGFPFLLMQEAKARVRPRIAPILLWPVRVSPEVGSRGRINLAFDRDREEVRLNPALESLLGTEAAARWQEVAKNLLGRSSVTSTEVVEAFHELAEVTDAQFAHLPSKDLRIKPGEDKISNSAALFHLAFLGQAVMEDLRQLRSAPPTDSSLETAFRVGDQIVKRKPVHVPEANRYFTVDSDPSQEAAVLEARAGCGLLIEGPPGTGKSQTIVNMVGDAIGTGRSLLIVCQKQAALEVVFKRLESAGLGGRIVMVNDVNKDRRLIIQAVRDQLEELFRRPSGASGWRQQRQQTAARIEALERDLDNQHRALHEVDPQTGLSYRLIVGDLIGIGREGETPSVPSLRQLLGKSDPGGLAMLQETCAPIARLWLPARYEASPLAETRVFAVDQSTVETFKSDVSEFAACERERLDTIERTPCAISIQDPEPYRAWTTKHGRALREINEETRVRLARWLDYLIGASGRPPGETGLQRRLQAAEIALVALPADTVPSDAVEVARNMTDSQLREWTAASDCLLQKPTFFQRVSPSRWIAWRRRTRFMEQAGLTDAAAFGAALHRELNLRPIRQELVSAVTDAGEPAGSLPIMRVPELLSEARNHAVNLADAEALVVRLEDYPDRDTAYAMARAATAKAVEEMIEGIDQGLARHAARVASSAALARLAPWMKPEWVDAALGPIVSDASNAIRVDPIVTEIHHIAAYQRFRARVPQLGDDAMAVFTQLARIRNHLSMLSESELENTVRRIIGIEGRLAWKARLEEGDSSLLFEAGELEAKAASLTVAHREMRQLNRRQLVEGLDTSQLRPLQEWEDITRLAGVRAKRLREFVDRGFDLGLMRLRPVWLVNPDVASRLLPLRKALFDTVIFDEASQMPVEYALPTLYRSRTMIVSGDEKQMPPSAFFSSRVESDETEVFEGQDAEEDLDDQERAEATESWNRREIKDCPDLLQLAKTVLPATTLQIHYRSVYRELIQFSNASFYMNSLSVPARHPADEIRRQQPIEVIRVDGVYEDQTNQDEAKRVADVLSEIWEKGGAKPPTVGVVTFNRKQADLIDDVLEDRAEHDPSFRLALTRERDRIENGEDVSFFVKNVENVQGDERDIIVFSSTFGRNAQGTFRRAFGVLGQAGGERRLNVAVTRARKKVVLITSMPVPLISDLLATRRQAASPRDFLQAYFEYARALSEGDLDAAKAFLARLTPEQRRSNGQTRDIEDGLQAAVAAEILALGWEAAPVQDDGAFGLDFAIEDPRTGLYGIGIECDAPRHRLLETARAREMWRPAVLRKSIPAIHRVSSHRWFHEPDRERERLRAAVVAAMGAKV